MNTIYRTRIEVLDYQEIKLTGKALSVAPCRASTVDNEFELSGFFDLWSEHWDDKTPTTLGLYVCGTGHPVPWRGVITRDLYRFLGTVVTPYLVWHIYIGPVK